MTTATAQPPNTDELTVVKHLAAGHSIGFAADAAGIIRSNAQSIAERCGHPDPIQLRRAVAQLLRRHDEQAHEAIPAAETLQQRRGHIVELRQAVGPGGGAWLDCVPCARRPCSSAYRPNATTSPAGSPAGRPRFGVAWRLCDRCGDHTFDNHGQPLCDTGRASHTEPCRACTNALVQPTTLASERRNTRGHLISVGNSEASDAATPTATTPPNPIATASAAAATTVVASTRPELSCRTTFSPDGSEPSSPTQPATYSPPAPKTLF
ncbi:hypothetical protein ABN034_12475 [Actinopolymorpha sp. B11F2]|uniref:hypothetical protein n=1 Tax=Actinopolymorpha sp. B11F2 TaxID=3160862 RepID=UPI0032E530DB